VFSGPPAPAFCFEDKEIELPTSKGRFIVRVAHARVVRRSSRAARLEPEVRRLKFILENGVAVLVDLADDYLQTKYGLDPVLCIRRWAISGRHAGRAPSRRLEVANA
jgi:hypothetical protein